MTSNSSSGMGPIGKKSFFIAIPSEAGEQWHVYDMMHSPHRSVFFGSKAEAEFTADGLNKRALAEYEQRGLDWLIGEIRHAVFRPPWIAEIEEEICCGLLSLPI